MREFSRFYDKQEPAVSRLPLAVNREVKDDVYSQRQTGNGRLLLVTKA